MTYSVRETILMSSESSTTSPARNQTEVFAVHGADPEILAYAMAKYSRSALSMRDSLAEISAQSAEQFLNTFYFQYGHRSIADLAHIAFAVERLCLLAAIVLVDETALGRAGALHALPELPGIRLVCPRFRRRYRLKDLYYRTIESLIGRLQAHHLSVLDLLRKRVSRPEG